MEKSITWPLTCRCSSLELDCAPRLVLSPLLNIADPRRLELECVGSGRFPPQLSQVSPGKENNKPTEQRWTDRRNKWGHAAGGEKHRGVWLESSFPDMRSRMQLLPVWTCKTEEGEKKRKKKDLLPLLLYQLCSPSRPNQRFMSPVTTLPLQPGRECTFNNPCMQTMTGC